MVIVQETCIAGSRAKGPGLGLSILYALIVEMYDGKINIKNRMVDDQSKGTVLSSG